MLGQPSKDVLNAFGIFEAPVSLAGGEGTTKKAGNFVLKPVENIAEANWRADLMLKIKGEGFRIPRPVKSKTNEWVYKNWCAYTFLEGKEVKNRWEEKIFISRRFHKTLANIAKPSFIETSTHPWAIADKMTWGIIPFKFGKELKFCMHKLLPLLKPIDLKNQLIHGDMAGNILFHKTLDPAVIDLSPYWHPAEYAEAIIVVDSIVWDKAPDTIINKFGNSYESFQLLLRAVIWRIKTTEEYIAQYGKGDINSLGSYNHLIDLISRKIG